MVKNIFVGTVEIARQIPLYADAFQKLGYNVTTGIRVRNPLFADITYDVDLNSNLISWPQEISNNNKAIFGTPVGLINRTLRGVRLSQIILKNDIFLFQWARDSFSPTHREYRYLKKLGKKIVSVFNGSDVRDRQAFSQWYKVESEYVLKLPYEPIPLSNTLYHLRMAELYSDLILSQPNQSVLAVRPYNHFFVAIDLSKYTFNIPARDFPLVVHIPSRKDLKGTSKIIRTLEELKQQGIAFDFQLYENLSQEQLAKNLTEADILIDELGYPLHGTITVEAMASGCAVATGNREDYEPFPPNRPIWHIDVLNLKEQLKTLIVNKALRLNLAIAGRKYIEENYNHIEVARKILTILQNPHPDHYPTFFTKDYILPENESIPDNLKQITSKIIQKWGLPEDVNPGELISRGLISAEGLDPTRPILRWKN